MKIVRPIGPRLLVKREKASGITPGGIHIPESAQKRSQEAEVLKLGTGGKDEDGNDFEFTVKEGDTVLIAKYGGTVVEFEDERDEGGDEFLLINEQDVMGIIEDEEKEEG